MKVYSLNEITDSNVLYNKKPPKFMNYLVLIVTVLIGVGIIWANKNVKTFIIKGQGVVVSEKKSYVMAKVPGEIKEVFIEEGKEVNVGDVLFTTNGIDADIQLGQVEAQINTFNNRIELLKSAEKNATNGTNKFNKNDDIEVEFFNKLSEAYIARKEFDVDIEELKAQDVTDKQIDDYVKKQKDKANEEYYKTISTFTNERKQYELELEKLEAQKVALEKSKEEFKVLAQSSGSIHINSQLTTGMVLQGGALVATISSKSDDLIIETMIPSSDRPRIHNGDEVSIVVGGLLQSEYGTIPGKVFSIDEDATIDNEKGNMYFKAKIKPDKTYLEDSKGEKVNVINVILEVNQR